jgi:hypothetical protein
MTTGAADLSINTVYEKSQEVASLKQRNSVEFLAWKDLRGKGDSFL